MRVQFSALFLCLHQVIGRRVVPAMLILVASSQFVFAESSDVILGEEGFKSYVNNGSINTLSVEAPQYNKIIAIENNGSINTLINRNDKYHWGGDQSLDAYIQGTNVGILNKGTLGTLINPVYSQIEANVSSAILNNKGSISSIQNDGFILSAMAHGGSFSAAISNVSGGKISNINNNGLIYGDSAIENYQSTVGSIINGSNGELKGNSAGILNTEGTISNLMNYGYVYSTNGPAIENVGTITTLTNYGSITANQSPYISNAGTIVTLNNLQNKFNFGSNLTYSGVLPQNYNVIIRSDKDYGQLVASTVTGKMAFGLFDAKGISVGSTYSAVLSGISASNLQNLTPAGTVTGTYNSGYLWTLSPEAGNATQWDLTINEWIYRLPGGAPQTNTRIVQTTPIVISPSSSATTGAVLESSGTTVVYNGTISDNGGSSVLVKTGLGTLVLNGTDTYSGGTKVLEGALEEDGKLALGSGPVFVAAGAELSGSGLISGAMTIAGYLKPGDSPGYLQTLSTVTMNSGSTFLQDIAGTAQASATSPVGSTGYYSFLQVTGGQFVISSGVTLSPRLSNLFSPIESGYGSSIYSPALGDKFRIVSADGGISGRFSSVTQPTEMTAGMQFMPFYNVSGSNSIDLAVIPTSYSATLATSPTNARSVAGVLDQLVARSQSAVANTAQEQLLYAVAGQSANALPAYAQSLAGEIYASTLSVVPQASLRVQQAVMSRLSDAPSPANLMGASGVSLSNSAISATNPGGMPTATISSNPAVNPYASNVSSAALSNGAAWGEIAYQYGNRANDSNASGYSSNLYQAVFGVDAYSEQGRKFGGGIALSNTNVIASQGTGTVQQGSLFLYGKLPVDTFVFDSMVSLGMSATDNSRTDPSGYSGSLSAKGIRGRDVLLSAGMSRPFDVDEQRITPYLRLTWQQVTQGSFSEGSSPAALTVDSFSASGGRAVLGVSFGTKVTDPFRSQYTYRINVGVGADTPGLINPVLNTSLAGLGTSVTTPAVGSTFLQTGLYATTLVADQAFLYLGVSAEARSGATLTGVNGGLQIRF